MSLTKAFSKETNSIITAQEADEKFAARLINSKRSFECPNKKCKAPVTCANLDRPKKKESGIHILELLDYIVLNVI